MFLEDRVKKKLVGWKRNTLSKTARLLLTNTSLAATSSYVMESTIIPQHTIAALEKVNRTFFSGDLERKKTLHSITWDRIYRPKELRVLAIPNLKQLNLAYIVKLDWRLF